MFVCVCVCTLMVWNGLQWPTWTPFRVKWQLTGSGRRDVFLNLYSPSKHVGGGKTGALRRGSLTSTWRQTIGSLWPQIVDHFSKKPAEIDRDDGRVQVGRDEGVLGNTANYSHFWKVWESWSPEREYIYSLIRKVGKKMSVSFPKRMKIKLLTVFMVIVIQGKSNIRLVKH